MSLASRPASTSGALLERSAELDTLAARLAEVERDRRGHVALVRGEAGVGKTALVRTFCDEHAPPAALLRGACEPLFTPRPLGPLFEVAETAGEALVALVERGARPYEVAATLTAELDRRSPAVFVLEDVHWADEATLDVFRLLVRRVQTIPALVVVTYRDDELAVADPLRIVLGELATSASITRLKLTGLSLPAVAELAEPHGADPNELYAATAGNPFFVVEALAAGAEGIPETVRDAVLARAARLDPQARDVLETVSILPAQAELWLLSALQGGSLDGLDDCLASGMLRSESSGVAFRHELARLAVEESVPHGRRVALHQAALEALAEPPAGTPDFARLAHHAEAAGNSDAVLRFAPQAAAQAAALGSHREAAAHYARTLRFGTRLTPRQRADLLQLRSRECYLTDEIDDAIEAGQEELTLRRTLGQRQEEGEALSWLAEIYWCPGRTRESHGSRDEALALFETLPPSPALAQAWLDIWSFESAVRGLGLAVELGDREIALRALFVVGSRAYGDGGRETLEQCIELAEEEGRVELVGWMFSNAIGAAIGARDYDRATAWIDSAVEFCSDRGLELYRFYALGYRAQVELEQGRWDAAAEAGAEVLRIRRASIFPRILGLVALGLVRARRGDPGYRQLLEEAWAIGSPTGELMRLGPPAAALAEAAWLAGDRDAVVAATDEPLRLAVEQDDRNAIGSLALWRRRAGLDEEAPERAAEPFAAALAGDWAQAAAYWEAAGCPYEAALARADSGDEEQLRLAYDQLLRLGARPAAAIVAGRLRRRGARGLPRGPRRATRENPAGLTPRQLEVLQLVAEGMRDSEIAERLVLSERTVGHHVGAILRKLDARNRGQATVEAVRLGLVSQDR